MLREMVLLPKPRQVEWTGGFMALAGEQWIVVETDHAGAVRVTKRLRESLHRVGGSWHVSIWGEPRPEHATVRVRIGAGLDRAESYRLTIDENGMLIEAADAAGAQYAAMTAMQMARQASAQELGGLPGVRISDWPDFAHRGVMLDISRDKVPKMGTLLRLVDLLAELKYNQLQLYTEHTFAYTQHEPVWREASPLTAEEICSLDRYCRERFIELVPNQNSFGHMERWLKHPEYNALAERPEAPVVPDESRTICPEDPRTLELLAGLYDELLPNFTSRLFNVGCDETFELGQGRSAEACAARGKERVYLDFLLKIHGLVRRHRRTMMLWGDIVLQHPELIGELPKDVIALNWGYEAEHPFAEETRQFAEAGVPFYVCPGTSTWNALAGRTSNMLENMRTAAREGLARGAIGYLVTDWGDRGHWQYLPFSYPGLAWGGAMAWAREANEGLDLASAMDVHLLCDRGGGMGRLLLELGDVHRQTGKTMPNRSVLVHALYQALAGEPLTEDERAGLDAGRLAETEAAIEAIVQRGLAQARLGCDDGPLIEAEVRQTAALLRHAARLLQARLAAPGPGVCDIPAEQRRALHDELEPLVREHRRLWLVRNREGGLADSEGRYQRLLAQYAAEAAGDRR